MNALLAWTSIRTTTTSVPDIEEDRLLEVGIWITNAEAPFEFRGAVNHILTPHPDTQGVVDRCTDAAKEWHQRNGIWPLMDMGVTQMIDDLQDDIIDLLGRFGNPGEYVLAGRGVGVIERPMLEEWCPNLSPWFNRDLVLDISGISYTMNMAGLSEQLEPHYEHIGHRAMHDAQRSSLEFQHYIDVFKSVPLIESEEGR